MISNIQSEAKELYYKILFPKTRPPPFPRKMNVDRYSSSCKNTSEIERPHPLLDATPVHDRSGLEEMQLTPETLSLGLEIHHGWLAAHDLVDGVGRRG